MKKKSKQEPDRSEEDKKFPLPVYKKEDDIYSREKEEPFEEEGHPGKRKTDQLAKNPGDDLDIPGAELDDADEAIGEEDEENNYYSLGGDDHDDLEEDKG
jgi:hypothetical protein